MPFSTSPVVGTIVMQSRGATGEMRLTDESDDSSLDALLASLVHETLPAGRLDRQPVQRVAFGRFNRFGFGASAGAIPDEVAEVDVVRADFARLEDELAAEYRRLAIA
jgi:hypothetical protein